MEPRNRTFTTQKYCYIHLTLTLQSVCPRSRRGLLPYEIAELLQQELSSKRFVAECTPAYIEMLHDFIYINVIDVLVKQRREHHMYDAMERNMEWDETTDLSVGASGQHLAPSSFDLSY